MSNTLEYILKLKDMLTPSMRQAASISNSSAVQIQQQFDKIDKSGKKMASSVDELRQRLDAVNKVRFGTSVQREFDIATRAANKLEGQIQKLESKGKPGGGGMIGNILGAAAGYGIFNMGKSALSKAAEREQQNISFGVMTGSQDTGNKMVNDLVSMGAKTPYESADLIKNAQTLKAFGIENEKVLPILNTIGDVASGDAQKLQSLSLAFAQTSSAGRLTGQDLLQMVNAGFNPLQQMVRDKVYPSMAIARKAMEDGAIGANMVEAAFKSATGPGGQFYQMMDKQSQTLKGRWSTAMDNVSMKLMALGQRLMPLASRFLDVANGMMEGKPWAIALAAAIGLLTVSLTWASVQAAIYAGAARSVAFFTGVWSGAQKILNASLWANPVTWVIATIIALIAIIGYLIYAFDGWGKTWKNLMDFGKHTWNAFKANFEIIWLTVQNVFMKGIELMEKGWYRLKSLWDEDGAEAGLARIQNQQNERAAEIARAKGVMANDLKMAQESLKWEVHANGKGLGTFTAEMKKKLGLSAQPKTNPLTANAAKADYGNPASLVGGPNKLSSSKSDSINSGGQRSIVINIGKIGEKIEQHIVGGTKEAAEGFAAVVREEVLRTLYSLNNVAV